MSEREIFIEALQKEDTEQRGAFLNEACGGNTDLRKAVEGLLAEHEKDRAVRGANSNGVTHTCGEMRCFARNSSRG